MQSRATRNVKVDLPVKTKPLRNIEVRGRAKKDTTTTNSFKFMMTMSSLRWLTTSRTMSLLCLGEVKNQQGLQL